MDTNASRIQDLVERPSESLSVELKRWLTPDSPEGKAKIIRTALSLRNHGGGYLVIGFDNDTLLPDKEHVPHNVRETFHVDKIQSLIAKFASEPFEISVEFPERDKQLYPVLVIPPGVKTPVASKSELSYTGGRILVDDVYVRSILSNNTPSTTKAGWKDWPRVVEVCFDNREADIGRFLRRHLGAITPTTVRELASAITKGTEPQIKPEDLLQSYLQESEERYQAVVAEKNLTLPEHGSWEVGLLLIGQIPKHSADRLFLRLLDTSNPNYTGWPVWLDSTRFAQELRPRTFQGVWEAIFHSTKAHAIDFWRLDPKGRFYLRRALEDDVQDAGIPPMSRLDFGLVILRTAEAIGVGLAFAKAMGCPVETTQLAYVFRWSKLRDRWLASWANPRRTIFRRYQAYDDEASSFVNVPLDTPLSALGSFVYQAVQPLFVAFDGFEIGIDIVDDLTKQLIQRRLR